jgi:integrase/recombinase XerD
MKDTASGFPTLLEMFFTRHLIAQRKASPHTIASYRDTFRLLLQFAEKRLTKAPSRLTMEDLSAPFLGEFRITWRTLAQTAPGAAICA